MFPGTVDRHNRLFRRKFFCIQTGAVGNWHSLKLYICYFKYIKLFFGGMLLFPDSPFSIVFVSSETTLEYSPDCQNVSVIRIGYDNAGPLIGRMHNLSVSNINSHMA